MVAQCADLVGLSFAQSAADVGLLVLTHHAAWNDEAEVLAEAVAEFDGPIEQARPGMTIDLS